MDNKKTRKFSIKKLLIFLIIILLLVISIIIFYQIKEYNQKQEEIKQEEKIKQERAEQEKLKNDILEHYNKYVVTNDVIDIYKLENNKYIKYGSIGKDQIIELKEIDITYKDIYLPIKEFENYYVYYEDITKVEEPQELDLRYKKYIPFNENIITNEKTSFYDSNDNLVYTFNESYDLSIIVKLQDKYGVEFNNQLLYVKKEDVKEIQERQNTTQKNTDSIAVLNYHFFYDADLESERKNCDQTICLSTQMFRKHLDYNVSRSKYSTTKKCCNNHR